MRFSFLSRITLTLILLGISLSVFISHFQKNIELTYQNFTLIQSKKIVTKIVNQVVLDNLSTQEVSLNYSKENYVSYDVNQINYLISSLSSQVVYVLENLDKYHYTSKELREKYSSNDIIYELEFSKVYDNIFFSSLGSKYPIKFSLDGDVLATSSLNVEEFGLNNALVCLNLKLVFSFILTLPLSTKLEDMEINIPLSLILVEGDVPSFLYGNHSIEGVNSYIIEVDKL